jgi:hypothetical protein
MFQSREMRLMRDEGSLKERESVCVFVFNLALGPNNLVLLMRTELTRLLSSK